jgi:tetratricopeptide (TPR) repeat protein
MRSNPIWNRSLARLAGGAVLGLALVAFAPAGTGADDDLRARALALYDQGQYAEALPLLEELDAGGGADGTLLYRLYFCLRQTGDPRSREALQRARSALEEEVGSATSLETPFYLANTYRNMGRVSDASQVARSATERVENGELPAPATGMEMFRLGKLYADQSREEPASEWYRSAVRSLSDGSGTEAAKPYIDWAARYLADRAWERDDFETAAVYLDTITSSGNATYPDLDRLASAACRAGRYGEAERAWQRAVRANPPDPNRPRYCAKLAALAEGLETLPESAPDGRSWSEPSKGDLEGWLLERATVARSSTLQALGWDVLDGDPLKSLMKSQRGPVRRALKGGRSWSELSAEERESLALEPAGIIAEILHSRAGADGLPEKEAEIEALSKDLARILLAAISDGRKSTGFVDAERARLAEDLHAAQEVFVRAGLEYALRGHSIREVAFFNGYAPLIFHANRWKLPDRIVEEEDGNG